MYQHTTDEVVMVRPAAFFANPETAADNVYQQSSDEKLEVIQTKALKEFDDLVTILRAEGLKVNVLQDIVLPSTPDSIFPNNWFSSHEGATMIVYPMFPKFRRDEAGKFQNSIAQIAQKKAKKGEFFRVIDYSYNTEIEKYLEGTGAMVIDRKNKVAYCCISQRADKELFEKFCKDTGHEAVSFHAQQDGKPVYHTNVIMGIGQENAIICLDAIVDKKEREMVENKLKSGGNIIVEITLEQVKQFLGNNLELKGKNGNILTMSEVAYKALTTEQIKMIEKSTKIVYAPIETIEFYGGGSVRCMIAEIF